MMSEMRRCDQLYLAITMYNDAVKLYVKTSMADHPNAHYYLIRVDAMEDLIRELFDFDVDFTFITCRKPYPDGKRDFIYKMMVMKEE